MSAPPAPVDETDGFIEMLVAERDTLNQAVNTQTDLYRKGLVEIDRLQSQLSVAKEALEVCERLDRTPIYEYGQADRQGNKPGPGKRWMTPKEKAKEALQKLGETGE